MANIQDLQNMKENIQRLKTKKDKAQGAMDESFKLLKKEFKVNNLADAVKLEKKLTTQENKEKEDFEEAFDAFEDKWGEQLEDE